MKSIDKYSIGGVSYELMKKKGDFVIEIKVPEKKVSNSEKYVLDFLSELELNGYFRMSDYHEGKEGDNIIYHIHLMRRNRGEPNA